MLITVFIIFCLSGVGIAALLTHKIYEIKKGATLISADARERADAVVAIALAGRKDLLIKKTRAAVGAFLINCRKAARAAFLALLHKTHAALTRLLERMKGRTNTRVGNKNNVSFFLKNVQEHKEEMRNASDAATSIERMK